MNDYILNEESVFINPGIKCAAIGFQSIILADDKKMMVLDSNLYKISEYPIQSNQMSIIKAITFLNASYIAVATEEKISENSTITFFRIDEDNSLSSIEATLRLRSSIEEMVFCYSTEELFITSSDSVLLYKPIINQNERTESPFAFYPTPSPIYKLKKLSNHSLERIHIFQFYNGILISPVLCQSPPQFYTHGKIFSINVPTELFGLPFTQCQGFLHALDYSQNKTMKIAVNIHFENLETTLEEKFNNELKVFSQTKIYGARKIMIFKDQPVIVCKDQTTQLPMIMYREHTQKFRDIMERYSVNEFSISAMMSYENQLFVGLIFGKEKWLSEEGILLVLDEHLNIIQRITKKEENVDSKIKSLFVPQALLVIDDLIIVGDCRRLFYIEPVKTPQLPPPNQNPDMNPDLTVDSNPQMDNHVQWKLQEDPIASLPSQVAYICANKNFIWVGDRTQNVFIFNHCKNDERSRKKLQPLVANEEPLQMTAMTLLENGLGVLGDRFGVITVYEIPQSVQIDPKNPDKKNISNSLNFERGVYFPSIGHVKKLASINIGSAITSCCASENTFYYTTIDGAIGAAVFIQNESDGAILSHIENIALKILESGESGFFYRKKLSSLSFETINGDLIQEVLNLGKSFNFGKKQESTINHMISKLSSKMHFL